MLRKTVQILGVLALMVILVGFTANTSFAEGMNLGDDAVTGMSVEQVEESFSDTDHPNLKPKSIDESRGFDIYWREGTGSYYFFRNGELMYKLMLMDDADEEDTRENVEEAYGDPVVEQGEAGPVYFYRNGNTGFKFMNYDEEKSQMWYGDIEMWNDAAEGTGLNDFPSPEEFD